MWALLEGGLIRKLHTTKLHAQVRPRAPRLSCPVSGRSCLAPSCFRSVARLSISSPPPPSLPLPPCYIRQPRALPISSYLSRSLSLARSLSRSLLLSLAFAFSRSLSPSRPLARTRAFSLSLDTLFALKC